MPVAGLLAPVPLDHLLDGVEVCRAEGKVAFGTRVWDTFKDLEIEAGIGAPVLIYASHATEQSLGAVVSWKALFAGWASATIAGGHPERHLYRPPSTIEEDSTGHWLGFWEVTDLRRLPVEDHIPIARLHDRKGRRYRRDFIPEGPILISGTG